MIKTKRRSLLEKTRLGRKQLKRSLLSMGLFLISTLLSVGFYSAGVNLGLSTCLGILIYTPNWGSKGGQNLHFWQKSSGVSLLDSPHGIGIDTSYMGSPASVLTKCPYSAGDAARMDLWMPRARENQDYYKYGGRRDTVEVLMLGGGWHLLSLGRGKLATFSLSRNWL